MIINISFYDIANEDELFVVNNVSSNPFKKGDTVSLTVNDLSITGLDEYPISMRGKLMEENDEMQKKYRLKSAILTKESKHARFDKLGGLIVTIEYHCNILGFL